MRIAVGIDGYSEGRDAAFLGASIAAAMNAELMLVAVHSDPLVVLPSGMDWKSLEKQAEAMLIEIRDAMAPEARIAVETDLSVPRALKRVVNREHRDLLVVGSSRRASEGRVRIGKRTRQLLCHFESALAVAPRGLHERGRLELERIGVGFDGGPESEAALSMAGSIADAAGAELYVRGVVDDRMPATGWSRVWLGDMMSEWEDIVQAEMASLHQRLEDVAKATGADGRTEVSRGRPADRLLEFSREVDLLLIGSRRWGPLARVMLGSTGEALMHDAGCSVLATPRPRD